METTSNAIYSVFDISTFIKHVLEENPRLQDIEVSGEIADLTYHGSGHVYFTLKDEGAQLSCAFFKSYAVKSGIRMKAGDKIVARGDINVYVPRGSYQLVVRQVRLMGVGDLYRRFLELKEKLEKEGLFDPQRKKALPFLPKKIAVLTSATGAAVHDIMRTLQRRFEGLHVLIFPTVVQGEQGKHSIVQNIKLAQAELPDLIILARGGGSLEDLWPFNEEAVVRAVAASNIPIITGIGHETDFTLADFAADFRASTPTAAAERAVPEKAAILFTLQEYEGQLRKGTQQMIRSKRRELDELSYKLKKISEAFLLEKRNALRLLRSQLEAQDLTTLLQKGYTLTLKNRQIVHSSAELKPGDVIDSVFADGTVQSIVE